MAQRKVLGIDPGSRQTGFAVLSLENRLFSVLECDVIDASSLDDQVKRLRLIYENVASIIERHKPDQCAVETPVYGIDPLAMLKLGRAQAAAMLAISNQNIPQAEYYPKAIKKSVTGNGNASKKQVAYMLRKLIKLPENRLTGDATDALAVAWCHFSTIDRPGGHSSHQKHHQNNLKSGWKAFVDDNPDRVKS